MTTPPNDEVDRLISAWVRERPDLDVSPLSILSRVTRLARHLDIMRRDVFLAHDIEQGEFDVLASLRRSGSPYSLSPSQLVTQNLVTSGTMTNRLDRLEMKQLVTREPDPNDGRGVVVTLTTQGKRTVDAALEDLIVRERALLEDVSKRERDLIADALQSILLPLDDVQGEEA